MTHRRRAALAALALAVLMAGAAGCNDKGKPCPEKGQREYKSGGETHVCVRAPNGGLEWQ